LKDIEEDASVVENATVSLRRVVTDISKACEAFIKRTKTQLFFEMFGTTPATKNMVNLNLSACNTENKLIVQINEYLLPKY
jgi:hypothetical protein